MNSNLWDLRSIVVHRGWTNLPSYQWYGKEYGYPQSQRTYIPWTGPVQQIFIFANKSDLSFSFLTGLCQPPRRKLLQPRPFPARPLFLPLLLSQLIRVNCLWNDPQLFHSFRTCSYGKRCQSLGCDDRHRVRSVQPVAKVGNWRINQHFFFLVWK